MEVQLHPPPGLPVEQGYAAGAQHAENHGVQLPEGLVAQGHAAAVQHGLSAVVADDALGVEQVAVRLFGDLKQELVVLKTLPRLEGAPDGGVGSDTEGHGGGAGVPHGEGGGKSVLQQPVGGLQGEGEGVLLQRLFVLPQRQGDEVLPLVHGGELQPPGEAVAAHLTGLAADVHPAVLQRPHNGEQDGVLPRPEGRVPLPDILQAVPVPQGDQLPAQAPGHGPHITFFQLERHFSASLL